MEQYETKEIQIFVQMSRLRTTKVFSLLSVAVRVFFCATSLAFLLTWISAGVPQMAERISMVLVYVSMGMMLVLVFFHKDLATFAPWWSWTALVWSQISMGVPTVLLWFDVLSLKQLVILFSVHMVPFLFLCMVGGVRSLRNPKELMKRRAVLREYAAATPGSKVVIKAMHKSDPTMNWPLDV